MSDRLQIISKLQESREALESYIYAKLSTLVPAQIRALRLKSNMPRQTDLARAAGKQQSQISSYETPGASNVTLETLARLASVFEVGLVVKFVPMSTMLEWENSFSQNAFNVIRLNNDTAFLNPPSIGPMRGIACDAQEFIGTASSRAEASVSEFDINSFARMLHGKNFEPFIEKPKSLEATLWSSIQKSQNSPPSAREAAQSQFQQVVGL